MIPHKKKAKLEVFDVPFDTSAVRSPEEVEKNFKEAVKLHPFRDNAHSIADIYKDGVLRDGNGAILGVLVREALPEYAAAQAAEVLRPAATKTSLRSAIFGGEPPNSGIAGYFDYRGSPIEFKCRKTAFTHEHAERWPGVFPMVDYVSAIYKRVLPECWARQNAAIPDIVRIHGSPFSTLTINSRFRTASHTDAGDFDAGYGCIACLEGQFRGVALTFDDFRVNFTLQPRDVLIFNTHHIHSNTEPELESPTDEWSRLTCVFYYRAILGERASIAEYRRRLLVAKQTHAIPPPVVDFIAETTNGDNFNRPAVVAPLTLTPFVVLASLRQLAPSAGKLYRLHEWLLATDTVQRARLLFGEALSTENGLPERAADAIDNVHSLALMKAPAMGGFKECDTVLEAATERQRFLGLSHLADCLDEALFEMWRVAREKWLLLVQQEWKRMHERNPARRDFSWNNRSEMNSAFFDLCEVAKEVMLALLHRETASPHEAATFWALYATHLALACCAELGMPEEAMSLKKLNVKLKDFTFGGTRYLKDMPEHEQKRRLERKARIEEVRRLGSRGDARKAGNWLSNDAFDYQTEDRAVEYDGVEHITPEANARAVADGLPGTALVACPGDEVISVLVILPPPATDDAHHHRRRANPAELEQSTEWSRLMTNAAAQAVLSDGPRNAELPTAVDVDGVSITYAYQQHEPPACDADVIVLQHVMATVDDDALARSYITKVRQRARLCLLMVETDVQCRHYYTLKPHVRAAYACVAEECYQELQKAAYGTCKARMRSKNELEGLLEDCCARYKFCGSPLNSTVLMMRGSLHAAFEAKSQHHLLSHRFFGFTYTVVMQRLSFAAMQALVESKLAGNEKETIIFDVRDPSETQATGMIPTAVNIPLAQVESAVKQTADSFEATYGIPKPTPNNRIITYCLKGGRAEKAAALFSAAGYTHTDLYPGSWAEWSENVKS